MFASCVIVGMVLRGMGMECCCVLVQSLFTYVHRLRQVWKPDMRLMVQARQRTAARRATATAQRTRTAVSRWTPSRASCWSRRLQWRSLFWRRWRRCLAWRTCAAEAPRPHQRQVWAPNWPVCCVHACMPLVVLNSMPSGAGFLGCSRQRRSWVEGVLTAGGCMRILQPLLSSTRGARSLGGLPRKQRAARQPCRT